MAEVANPEVAAQPDSETANEPDTEKVDLDAEVAEPNAEKVDADSEVADPDAELANPADISDFEDPVVDDSDSGFDEDPNMMYDDDDDEENLDDFDPNDYEDEDLSEGMEDEEGPNVVELVIGEDGETSAAGKAMARANARPHQKQITRDIPGGGQVTIVM